jgi:hypothetical protein
LIVLRECHRDEPSQGGLAGVLRFGLPPNKRFG